jgi:hypothetical protein
MYLRYKSKSESESECGEVRLGWSEKERTMKAYVPKSNYLL